MTTGQAVEVGYTDPTTGNDPNAIQDIAGNDAATLPPTAVDNGSTVPGGDTTAPTFVSATLDTAGTSLTLTYSEALDGTNLPPLNSFVVTADGQVVAVTGVTVNGSSVVLTLATAVTTGQAVTVGYTDPTTGNDLNAIQDLVGNDAATLPTTTVTNDSAVLDTTAPSFVSAVVDPLGLSLTLTYNELLDFNPLHLPTTGSFTVTAGGQLVTVTGVAVVGNNVVLTLGSPVTVGQAVTVGYTDPTTGNDLNAIQDLVGNDAATLPTTTVTNDSAVLDTTAPSFVSAVVDPLGLSLTLTYNELLDFNPLHLPTTGSFTVTAGGQLVTVTGVAVVGNNVVLTLGSPVTVGQAVTVGYTDPTTGNDLNAIQDLVGNDAATLPTTTVTNDSTVPAGDTTPPIFVSAAVGASGTQLTLTYNEPLDLNPLHLPTVGSFNVNVGGQSVTVTAVAVVGNNVVLTLGTIVTAGQNVKVSYTDPTAANDLNAIQDLAGNDAATLPSTTVSNDSLIPSFDTTPPAFVSAAVGASGTQLTLAYNEALDAVNLPPLGSFNVNVGGQLVAVIGVSISGTNVILTLGTAVTQGQTVKVSYTDPTTGNDLNAIQDHAGNDAVTLPSTTVSNGSLIPSLDTIPPAFVSATVGTSGTQLTLVYNEALDAVNLPAIGSFAVTVGGQLVTVTGISVNGSNVILTLGSVVTSGQSVQVGYTDPTAANDLNAIQDHAGNDAATLPLTTAINDSTIPPAPIILGAQDDVGTTGNLYSGDSTDDSTPTLFGTAEANSVVTIYVDGVIAGVANTDATGHWSYTPNLSITTHTITATVKNPAGNISLKSDDFNLSVFAPNPIENPITALKAGTLLGLVGLDALGLIKLDNQPVLAYDVNNDLKKVTITNQTLIGLSATIKYSQTVADILGLTIVYNESGILVGPKAVLTITAKDGGTISNEVMTEFLASVYIPSLLNISVLPTLGIEAWDVRYTNDGNKDASNQIIGYSKTSATSLLDVKLLSDTKVGIYDETTGLDHHTSTTSVRIYGTSGDDTILGGSANDILRGGDGNDTLNGGAGNDLLEGGKGNDILIGGAGSDTAVYRLLLSNDATGGNGTDTWKDFHKGNVTTDTEADKIDIRELLDSTANMGNISQYVFTTYDSVNNKTVVQIDRDGSGGTYVKTDLLILENVNTTLEELLQNHQLIF